MKFLFLITILFVTSCSGQLKPEEQSKVDTAKIFNPKPDLNDDLVLQDISKLKNSLFVQDDFYVFLLNEQEYKIPSSDTLKIFFTNHFAELSQRRFFILYDGSEDKFPKIVSVIDNLRASNIDNYRVINIQNYLEQVPQPIAISGPTFVTVENGETSDFKIDIGPKTYKVLFNNQTEVFSDTLGIDKFIKRNKELIASKKIMLNSKKEIPSGRVKALINILNKYNFKFEMMVR